MENRGPDKMGEDRHLNFQQQQGGLSDLIESLTNTALEPASKTAIVEDCQRGLSDLSKQIQDNANIIPAHDLRMYSKVIQGLTEKFERVRRDSGPKRRFQFKSASIKVKNDVSMKGLAHSTIPADISDTPQTQSLERSDVPGVGGHGSDPGNSEAALPKCPAIAGKGLQIQSLYDEFYVTAAQDLESTMMIRDVHRSLIDVSLATTERMSLSTLAISDVSYSLLLCGTIAGAAHVTGLRGTTVVLHSGQLRAHNCIDCAFYLVCSSRPIIEHCKDLRFGPIPSSLQFKEFAGPNLWNQIDDFNWLKAGHSPNWRELRPGDQDVIPDDVWRSVADARSQPNGSKADSWLRMAKISVS